MTTTSTHERSRVHTSRRWPALAMLVPLALAGAAAGCSSSTNTDTSAQGTKPPQGTTAGGGTTKGTTKPGGVTQVSFPKMTVTASESGDKYSFAAPDTTTTGWAEVTLENKGKLGHQLNIARLKDGVTQQQAETALTGANPESALIMVDALIGGPNNVEAGEATTTIVNFDKPGTYVMICFMQDPPDFKPHVSHGMYKFVTVTGGTTAGTTAGTSAAAEPKYDGEIEMKDYEWILPDNFNGKGWMELSNSSESNQPHELAIYSLKDGKTLEDAKTYFATPPPTAETGTTMAATGTTEDMEEYAPVSEVGGVGAISKGNTAFFNLDLKPGNYVFVCFIPDAPPPAHDLKPHFMHGMIKEVTVK